jgi:GNAT superfamily N-acetyltransferase
MKTRSEKVTTIKRLISDENLRHVIFNYEDEDDDFLSDEKNCLLYFSNIMTFSMLLVWSTFLDWKRNINDSEIGGNNSFWRIYNILDKICDPTKINGEIVDDFLINLEIDCLLDTDTNKSFVELVGLSQFFKFSSHDNKLAKYIHLVKQRRISSRIPASEFDFDAFCGAIYMFPYLRDAEVVFSDMGTIRKNGWQDLQKISLDCSEIHCETKDKPNKLIDFNQSMCVIPNVGTYYMEDFHVDDARRFDEKDEKNQSITINYVQLGAADQFSVYLTDDPDYSGNYEYIVRNKTVIEEFFLNYDIINTYKSKTDNIFFRDYILLNNRYLKELSYTISDALSVQLKDTIIKRYSPKYKEIFDKMYVVSLYNKEELIGYRWDEIILFLLLEEGVYEFLRSLLQNGADYGLFLKAFRMRFGKDKILAISNEEEIIANPEGRLPPGSSMSSKIDSRTKALVMLAIKTLTQNDWAWEKSFYPTTIDDIIAECDRVYATAQYTEEQKIIYLSNTILRVVRFVNKFYRGLFQYAKKKRQSLLALENSDRDYDDYKQYNKAKETWIENMKRTISGIGNGSSSTASDCYFSANQKETAEKVRNAFERLIEMNNEYSSNCNNQNEILFDVLGRKYLFASEKMNSYGEYIVSVLTSAGNFVSDKLYGIVKQFLLYMKTGLDNTERDTLKKGFIELAIYPIVGQYCSGVTSFDGYRYSLFRTLSSDKSDGNRVITIKMIIDDEFDFGYSYYCVPNINRIANVRQERSYDKIWISPIIIPCSVYLPQSFSKLERLSDARDYESAIELIYESDVFVGEKLFGTLENAKKILPLLFNEPQSKFYKDYYRIMRNKDEIIAIASIYDYSNSFQDYDIIRKSFDDLNIIPPPTFEIAMKDLRETFNEYLGKNYYHVDNICVKEEYRQQGLGRSLMMYILKEAEEAKRSVRLFVYSENNVAYSLYSSLGFVPIAKQFNVDRSKDYYQMVKI